MLGFILCKISEFLITAIKLDKPSMPHKPVYALFSENSHTPFFSISKALSTLFP